MEFRAIQLEVKKRFIRLENAVYQKQLKLDGFDSNAFQFLPDDLIFRLPNDFSQIFTRGFG